MDTRSKRRSIKLNPLSNAFWIYKCFIGWIYSRKYSILGRAIPAILASGFLIFLAFNSGSRRVADRRETYRKCLTDALDRHDDATAAVAAKALIDLSPDDEVFRFQLGLIELRRENKAAGQQIFSELVYYRKYVPAIVWWMQQKYPLSTLNQWNQESHKDFQNLAAYSVSNGKGDDRTAARKIYVNYLVNMKAYKQAQILLMEFANSQNPEMLVPAAIVSERLGDTESVKRYATEARNYYRKLLETSPLDLKARNAVAESSLMLRDWKEAIQVLERGIALRDEPRLRDMLVKTLSSSVEILREESKTDQDALLKRFQLIHRAIQINPNSTAALNSMVSLVIDTRDNQEKQFETLRRALLNGVDPESSHFIQGTILLMEGKYKEAMVDLKAARTDGPRMGEILNNMAIAIANMPDGDLEEALRLTKASRLFLPGNPQIADTYASILLKMKKYQEAIPFYEEAMRLPELKKSAYEGLAEVYRGLGQEAKAKQYEEEAKLH